MISLFTDISSEMTFGILPIFIIYELKASSSILGVIEGIGEATNYISRVFSGYISDKVKKRKLFIFIGYLISTISKPLLALSYNPLDVLIIRFSDRIGKGVRTPARDTLLSESISKDKIGKAFGIHRSLDQMGAIIGPLLASILLSFIGIRGIFLFSLLPGIIALTFFIFVKEKKVNSKRIEFRLIIKGRFLLLLSIITIFSLGAFNFSFILLSAISLGLEDAIIPILYAIINLAHVLISYPSGVLSDRIGRLKVLIIGFSLFLITSILGFLFFKIEIVILMAIVYGSYIGIMETVQRAVVADYSEEEVRGTAYGIYYLFIGISYLIANIVFGVLWDIFGSYAFLYSIITSSISIIAMLLLTYLKKV
ncbi:MAG: MFS transporter [Candidatus Nitrosocaldaceae archaeon]|nr:MAG: MFS transporter [Candidatus Nitrosocaldaceae archaeon]